VSVRECVLWVSSFTCIQRKRKRRQLDVSRKPGRMSPFIESILQVNSHLGNYGPRVSL
jgi:hypothetical protein